MIVREHVPVAKLTSFRNVGTVPRLVIAESLADIRTFLKRREPYVLLGKGSNTLLNPDFSQKTVLVISLAAFEAEVTGSGLSLGAGLTVTMVMKLLIARELTGLEFAAGVPASIGGMTAMNFGCWDQTVGDLITRVQVVDETGETGWVKGEAMGFGYRTSILQERPWIAVRTEFKLSSDSSEAIRRRIADAIRMRAQKQPVRLPTFGSIFRNPLPQHSARLIEDSGLKGYELEGRGVRISEKHANFMVNLGGASFDGAVRLIQDVQERVRENSGVSLQTEVKIVA